MTRLFTSGAETGDFSDVQASASMSAMAGGTGRSGSYAFLGHPNANTGWAKFYPFTPGDVVYVGLGFYCEYTANVCRLLDTGGAVLATLLLVANGTLAAYRGDSANWLESSPADAFLANQWQYIEIYYKCADSGGRFQVKVNGLQVINYTGDTKPGASDQITQLQIGPGTQNFNTVRWDDIIVNDDAGADNSSFPGVIKLVAFRPSGNGDVTGLIRGGADSGANWNQVEEVPASAADYVYDIIADEYDLYAAGNPTIPAGGIINNVIVVAVAAMDSGAGNIAAMMKSNATEIVGGDIALSATYRTAQVCRSLDPDGDQAWDSDAVNAMQIGVKVR